MVVVVVVLVVVVLLVVVVVPLKLQQASYWQWEHPFVHNILYVTVQCRPVMCSVHLYVILLLKSTSQFHFITCFHPPLPLKYLACSLHVLQMGSVMYIRQLFILSPLRLFHRLQISHRSILQTLKSFQPLVQSKRRETKQPQPNDNWPKTSNDFLVEGQSFLFTDYTEWSKSLCVPDDYNTETRCTQTFWSPCISLSR